MQSGAVLSYCWRIAAKLWLERSEGAMRLSSLPAGLKQGQLVVDWHVDDILHLQGQFVPVKFPGPTSSGRSQDQPFTCARYPWGVNLQSQGCSHHQLCFCTCSRSSWLSGGCLLLLCGSTTVNRSGFSALRAPRITAALVPVAPEVYMWLSCNNTLHVDSLLASDLRHCMKEAKLQYL